MEKMLAIKGLFNRKDVHLQCDYLPESDYQRKQWLHIVLLTDSKQN